MNENLEKFNEDHKEEIDIYEAYMAKKEAGGEDYGDEEEEDEDGSKANKEPPVLPKFNQEEFLEKWDEENPDIEI